MQREKHKTRGQNKKSAYTHSKPENTRKVTSSSETYPIHTEGKRSGLHPLGCLARDVQY